MDRPERIKKIGETRRQSMPHYSCACTTHVPHMRMCHTCACAIWRYSLRWLTATLRSSIIYNGKLFCLNNAPTDYLSCRNYLLWRGRYTWNMPRVSHKFRLYLFEHILIINYSLTLRKTVHVFCGNESAQNETSVVRSHLAYFNASSLSTYNSC